MWFIYVIKNTHSKEIYIGKTNNFRRRLSEHNRGNQLSTKRKYGDWIPIYLEIYRSKKDADERELKLKQHGRAKQELLKRIKNCLII